MKFKNHFRKVPPLFGERVYGSENFRRKRALILSAPRSWPSWEAINRRRKRRALLRCGRSVSPNVFPRREFAAAPAAERSFPFGHDNGERRRDNESTGDKMGALRNQDLLDLVCRSCSGAARRSSGPLAAGDDDTTSYTTSYTTQ